MGITSIYFCETGVNNAAKVYEVMLNRVDSTKKQLFDSYDLNLLDYKV